MPGTHRILQEQAFHNRQAAGRAAFLREHPGHLLVAEDEYLDHEPWIRPALDRLGNVHGKRLLEFGCGHGMAAVVLARRGARVTAFDLSGSYLREARARAIHNRVDVDFVQANGEYLPFADASFDCIWGNAVLHHMDLERAAPELKRVLAPGGLAVFCEPWGGNPFLDWARRHLPYSGKHRTPAETPLTRSHLVQLRAIFPRLTFSGYQFLSMVSRVWRRTSAGGVLARWDNRLLRRHPSLKHWCRYALLTLCKD